MSRCPSCDVTVQGPWTSCPLCGQGLDGAVRATGPGPLPVVELRFSARRLLRALFLGSLGVIAVSFAAQLLLVRDHAQIGWFRSVWLGVTCLWLLVMMAVRKRRNVAKAAVYLVVLVGLVCTYWDYLSGWHRWALTYAVPLTCAGALLAVLIAVTLTRAEVGEHLLYNLGVALLALVPVLFLSFGWTTTAWPTLASVGLGLVVLVLLQTSRGSQIRHELAKRLHL